MVKLRAANQTESASCFVAVQMLSAALSPILPQAASRKPTCHRFCLLPCSCGSAEQSQYRNQGSDLGCTNPASAAHGQDAAKRSITEKINNIFSCLQMKKIKADSTDVHFLGSEQLS